MPTNAERREVAEKLRELAPGSDWPDMVAKACGLNPREMSNNFHEFTGELCDRLADLIEPEPERTCAMRFYPVANLWRCSECLSATHVERTNDEPPKFCQWCEAKVVKWHIQR